MSGAMKGGLQLVREAREGEGAAETRGTDGLCRGGRNGYLAGGQSARQRDGESELFDRYTSNIRFKDECLEDVLRAINKESAGWQIEAASPTLGKRRLTVEFSNNSPESVAELICWTFD